MSESDKDDRQEAGRYIISPPSQKYDEIQARRVGA